MPRAEVIHIHSHVVELNGDAFAVCIYGDRRADGTWVGWLEFHPLVGNRVVRTDPETTQSSRAALDYWAGGLEPVYLEGALVRALDREEKQLRPPRGALH